MSFEGPLKPKLQDDSKTISQEPSSSLKCSIGTHTSVLSDLPRDFPVLQFTFCFSPSLLIQQLHLSSFAKACPALFQAGGGITGDSAYC